MQEELGRSLEKEKETRYTALERIETDEDPLADVSEEDYDIEEPTESASLKDAEKGDEKLTPTASRWNPFASFGSYLKSFIISPQTEEALREVFGVMKSFFKDIPISFLDMTVCLFLMNAFLKRTQVHTELFVKEISFVEKSSHYLRFAVACFGWKMIYGYQYQKKTGGIKEGILGGETNIKVLLEYTGIKREDIIDVSWSSKHFSPGHVLVIDHSTRSVVLAIRGTFNTKDTLTDLVGSYSPFKGGQAHTGILKATKTKAEYLIPLVMKTMKDYKGYELVLTGHSLGAGVAALLATMINDEYNIPMHCYAFAPPCVLSLDLAQKSRSFISSFVLNDDMVPRLSYSSMEDLKNILLHLHKQSDSNLKRLFQVCSAGNTLGKSVTNRLSSYFGPDLEPDLSVEQKNKVITMRLHPPGQIFHLYSQTKGLIGVTAKYDTLEQSDPSLFFDIILSASMFSDHMPDQYEKALKDTLDRLKNEQGKVTPSGESLSPPATPVSAFTSDPSDSFSMSSSMLATTGPA